MQHIAIVSKATRITSGDAAAMTAACVLQMRRDIAPAWDRHPAAIRYYPNGGAEIPPAAHVITIVDTIPDVPAGVLGYHTEDAGGILSGFVACSPSLDNGGHALHGDWSVCSVLSHEIAELFVDPNCQLWADNGAGRAYSFEVCDPCEAPTYVIDDPHDGGPLGSVSNFVTPAWFDADAPPSKTQFDHLGLIQSPFTILPGGYCVYESEGQTHQINGERMPGWRLETKLSAAARTRRKIARSGEPGMVIELNPHEAALMPGALE